MAAPVWVGGDPRVRDTRAQFSALHPVAGEEGPVGMYTFPCTDDIEAIGVNTPDDRRRLEQYLLERDRS